MEPFFSLIIPCCDVEPYVRECLDSVLRQPFANWECLIGVETSRDKTEEIVREYEAKDPRFKVFTGPRSGGCSASRNTGIERSRGQYVIFLDGDDTIAEGALQRLHEKISARAGADLYPCAIRIRDDITGIYVKSWDNYPADFDGELTGTSATLMIYKRSAAPCPMLQMTVFRSEYLKKHNLRCLLGVKWEDNEFSPRALYLAKRVIPIHEPFYIYRKRGNSITSQSRNSAAFLKDFAVIVKSLLAFHATVSRSADFERQISSLWAKQWLNWLYFSWFAPRAVRNIPRKSRIETLCGIFADGFGDFDLLCHAAARPRRIAARFVKLAVQHPAAAWMTDAFFLRIYYPLVSLRDRLRPTL